MGKYDQVIAKFEKLPNELITDSNPERQAEIDKYKESIEDKSPAALAALYAEERKTYEKLETDLKAEGIKKAGLEQLITEVYEGEGITNIKMVGGGSVRTEVAPHAIVQDKALTREWCLENGFGDQMVLPWMTLNSTVKELLLAGEEPPPGVAVYLKSKVVLTRGK